MSFECWSISNASTFVPQMGLEEKSGHPCFFTTKPQSLARKNWKTILFREVVEVFLVCFYVLGIYRYIFRLMATKQGIYMQYIKNKL